MANVLDKTISFFSPSSGLKRARARAVLDVVTRGYDGASSGPRVSNWRPSSNSPDTDIQANAATLRARSRDLINNNKYVESAVSTHVDNFVGTGIIPRAASNNPDLNQRINDAWDLWVEKSAPDGQLDFYGQQGQLCAGLVGSGEMFGRRRTRRFLDERLVPMQVQVFESEFIDESKREASSKNRQIVSGIEFDKIGARTGYWMYSSHPNDANGFGGGQATSKLIKSADVFHLYEPKRTQVRGLPWTTPIIIDAKEYRDYEGAELVRKLTEACLVGSLDIGEEQISETDATVGVGVFDTDGNRIEQIEPGLIYLTRGKGQLNFNAPAVGGNTEQFTRLSLRGISAGMRAPYELVAKDFGQVNYSSGRSALVAYRAFVRRCQKHLMIHQVCRPVWRWFLEMAHLVGIAPEEPIPVMWTLPIFEHINPIDDVRADLIAIRSGMKTLQQVITERGGNPRKVLEEIQEANVLLDDMGIILDSDPRYLTSQGQLHQQMQAFLAGDPSGEGNDSDES
ncbi:Phage portal protein, lambda family [Pseudovibrio axinellae]|uniref:Phage portal protein, lambda family n=1 Tax=Pseudovibrio axinellae TaxID=989403 RepID=A0A165XGJ8_9HYPH|nr:phage portal protein [Pseudovibrio axinellae]KZL17684.1 Phage portal protein, lambda family [Pseudovibrio axinellae]SER43717.1 phage portal protein, lambda family [Pseudovibrio axinellae]